MLLNIFTDSSSSKADDKRQGRRVRSGRLQQENPQQEGARRTAQKSKISRPSKCHTSCVSFLIVSTRSLFQQEEEAAKAVLQDFVATFDSNGKAGPKMFVKGDTINPASSEDKSPGDKLLNRLVVVQKTIDLRSKVKGFYFLSKE